MQASKIVTSLAASFQARCANLVVRWWWLTQCQKLKGEISEGRCISQDSEVTRGGMKHGE
jgi:hypothetical protein